MRWYSEVWERARSTPTNLLVGEGFGKPLLEHTVTKQGVAVRQPHNTHLSVLARLGLVGVAFWMLFHFLLVRRFVHVLRRRGQLDKKHSDLMLWLFIFYILFMLVTSVQPYLEFSYGAIPFYFLTGFALGIMRSPLSAPRPDGPNAKLAPRQ
jgi:O-antigen ligase